MVLRPNIELPCGLFSFDTVAVQVTTRVFVVDGVVFSAKGLFRKAVLLSPRHLDWASHCSTS